MKAEYPVLDTLSSAYPRVKGRLLTCYSPVRHSCTPKGLTVRLACVKHAASVRPEPGSNSPLKNIDSHKGESSTSTSLKPDRTKKLAQSIFILKETITTKPSPKRNVSMATGNNLALTLSTLLSSQVSGATRTSIHQDFRLGQLDQSYPNDFNESNSRFHPNRKHLSAFPAAVLATLTTLCGLHQRVKSGFSSPLPHATTTDRRRIHKEHTETQGVLTGGGHRSSSGSSPCGLSVRLTGGAWNTLDGLPERRKPGSCDLGHRRSGLVRRNRRFRPAGRGLPRSSSRVARVRTVHSTGLPPRCAPRDRSPSGCSGTRPPRQQRVEQPTSSRPRRP